MTEYLLPTEPEPPEEGEDGSRRHALVGLAALAGLAALIVLIALVASALSGGGHHAKGGGGLTAALDSGAPAGGGTASTTTPTATTSQVTSQSVPPSTSALPTSPATGNPCPSVTPCAVAGDAGAAVAAVNQFRASHGAAPVPGAVSPQAQQCALQQGEGPSCAPHYAWQAVPAQDGQKVISMLTGRGGGAAWLLDPKIRSFSIGWAYAPGAAGGPGLYECAILKITA